MRVIAFLSPLLAVAAVALAQEPPPPHRYTPADMIVFAARDLPHVSADAAPYTRWLALWNVRDPAKRLEKIAVLQGHTAGLNREPDWMPLQVVANTDNTLLRFDIRDYGWTRELYESLKDVDPFYHVKLQAQEPTDPSPDGWKDGKSYTDNTDTYTKRGGFWFDTKGARYRLIASGERDDQGRDLTRFQPVSDAPKGKKIVALSPILSETAEQKTALTALVNATQSSVPVLGGMWFLQQTAIEEDRAPAGYYDFLGIKNRADFDRLIGFNAKVNAEARRVALLEAVARSGVVQQPRRIQIDNTVGDFPRFVTLDNKKALDQANPLRVTDQKNFTHVAEEAMGPKPDGWMAWGLFTADQKDKARDGTLQNSAPDFLGFDTTTRSNDGRIHINLACWRCHTSEQKGGLAGFQEIRQWYRGQPPGFQPLALQSPDYEQAREFRQQYARPITPVLERARLVTTERIKAVTGFTPAQWGDKYGLAFYEAIEKPVSIDGVEADLGVERQAILKAFAATLQLYKALDPVLMNLIRETNASPDVIRKVLDGEPGVMPDQWLEAYFLAGLALRGIAPVETTRIKTGDTSCWMATFSNRTEKRR